MEIKLQLYCCSELQYDKVKGIKRIEHSTKIIIILMLVPVYSSKHCVSELNLYLANCCSYNRLLFSHRNNSTEFLNCIFKASNWIKLPIITSGNTKFQELQNKNSWRELPDWKLIINYKKKKEKKKVGFASNHATKSTWRASPQLFSACNIFQFILVVENKNTNQLILFSIKIIFLEGFYIFRVLRVCAISCSFNSFSNL